MPTPARLACLLARTAGVAALAVPFGPPTAADAPASHLVTSSADDFLHPAPGTLRHVLTNDAKPGDTIRFASAFVIEIDSFLEIPQELTNLTIEGPVELRNSALRVYADGTQLTKITLAASHASVGNWGVGIVAADVRIAECTFSGDARLFVDHGVGAVVDHNTFDVSSKRRQTPVMDDGSVRSTWTRNTIRSNVPIGFSERDSSELVFEMNDVSTSGDLAPRSGRIKACTFGDELHVRSPEGPTDGPLVIEGSTCSTMRVSRPDLEVMGNTVTGDTRALTALFAAAGARTADTGYVKLVGNTVTAGAALAGLRVATNDNTTDVLVEGNTITGGKLMGIGLDVTNSALVRSNTIHSGGGKGGGAIKLSGAGTGGVTFEKNVVEGAGGGAGVLLTKGAGTATLRDDNRISGCKSVAVSAVGRTLVSDGTTCDGCGGGFLVGKKTRAVICGGSVTGNRGAGIFADASSSVEVARVAMSGNTGPGIDLSPARVTPNNKKKKANGNMPFPDELEFDDATGRVTGRSLPYARIDAYAAEDGLRAGNPKNGEGAAWLGETTADGIGEFTWPASGRAPCPPSKKLTFTATRAAPGKVETSEFSENLECSGGPPIALVSQSGSGQPGDDHVGTMSARYSSVAANRTTSQDGDVVVFVSRAANLVPGDSNGSSDVFLRNVSAGTTVRVTRTASGGQVEDELTLGDTAGYDPSVSDDGRFVAYVTDSPDVIADDDDNRPTVVLFDAQSGTTVAVTDPLEYEVPLPSGLYAHLGGFDPSVSGDGSAVAFTSEDRDWVAGDAGLDYDIFVWTRASGAIERVSVTSGGGEVNDASFLAAQTPRLSRDARFCAFTSRQALVPGNDVPGDKVFVRDRQGGTEIVSVDAQGAARTGFAPQISDDGRFVVFTSADALVGSDVNGVEDVYLHDRQTHTVTRMSVRADGNAFGEESVQPTISGDGRWVAFATKGSYVTPGGPTVVNVFDLYLVDRTEGTVVEASVGPSGEALGSCTGPWLSRDGRHLAFESNAQNLVELGPSPTRRHVYLRDLSATGD